MTEDATATKIVIDDAFIREWHPKYDLTENDESEYQRLVAEVARDLKSLGTISQNTFLAVWNWKGAMRVIRHVNLDEYNNLYTEAFRHAASEPPERKLATLLAPGVKLPGVEAPTGSTILHFMCPQTMPIIDVRTVEVLFAAGLLSTDRRDLAHYEEFRQAIEGIRHCCPGWSMREIDRALFAYHKQFLERGSGGKSDVPCHPPTSQRSIEEGSSETGSQFARGVRNMTGTNHDRFASVFRNRKGRTFSTAEITKLMLAESDIQPGSVLPNDHGEGNKGECPCVGTNRQIFERVGHGMYRVRDYLQHGTLLDKSRRDVPQQNHFATPQNTQGVARNGSEIQPRRLEAMEDAGRRHIVEGSGITSRADDKAFFRTLPFPIAIVDRKVSNAPNDTQRFSLLIELFEVVIRFLVLVQVADYLTPPRQMGIIDKIRELSQLSKPALGTWVNLFRSLSQFQFDSPFLKEIRALKLNEYQRIMDDFVNVRNESFRGHGATLTEVEYEQKFQKYAPSVYDLVKKMGFLANYRLVKTGSMERNGDVYRISVQVLMGDNPVFKKETLSSHAPLDTQKVLYLNSSLDALTLDPYIILEPCTECHRPELLLLDKFSDKKITYLGYESGHKPTYTNVSKLPLALREVALKHS
jgi:hypothetical protein